MDCFSCGKANAEGVSFCEYCGVNLRSQSAAAQAPALVAPSAPSAAHVAEMSKQLGKSFLSSLSLGEKFVGAGALAAILGFFLPFLAAPDLSELTSLLGSLNGAGQELAHASISLFALTKVLGAIYFILIAAITSGVMFYVARTAAPAKKLFMSGFQVLIGSLIGPIAVFALLFVPMIQSVASSGYWLTALGFCSIATGGLITIGTFSKAAR